MSEIQGGKTERTKYWAGQIETWTTSGLSQVEFCRRQGISVAAFRWWKGRLRKTSADQPKRRRQTIRASEQFREVRLAGMYSAPTYEIVLPRGRTLRLPPSFDPAVVTRLITVVESC